MSAMLTAQAPLVQHFDLIAQAPGGVARLRELILTLAVQGKLVPQDPSDEPASELLKKIRAEKDRLISEGRIKRDKPLADIADEEKPFALPQGWEWARLDSLSTIGLTDGDWIETKDQDPSGTVRLIQLADVGDGFFKNKSDRYISTETCRSLNCTLLQTSDVLIARLPNPIGRACVFPGLEQAAITAVDVAICRIESDLLPKFVALAINAPTTRSLIESYGKGATRFRVSTGHLKTLPFAVPPKAEQSRIVTRVEELMQLCDALEASGQLEAQQHAQLVNTLLGTLTQSETPEALADNWQRIATHFDVLLDCPEAVDALEQTILQLAVRGLLVPQDTTDEPASVLLQKIRTEKDHLIAQGKIKRDKPLPPITDEEKPFELPQGWEWARLSDLLPEFQNGASSRGDKGGEPTTVLRLADIKNRRISLADTRQIPIDARDIQKYQLQSGDILITRVNGSADIVGQFNLCDRPVNAIYCDHFIRLRVSADWLDPLFATLLGESDLVRQKIKAMFITTAGQKTVNQGHIGSLLFPLPPLAEQSRIVTGVNELRALTANLRQRLIAAQSTQGHLADALIAV